MPDETETTRRQKPHMLSLIKYYEDGRLTHAEFFLGVARLACPEEIREFLSNCPSDLLDHVRAHLEDFGNDESKWPRIHSWASSEDAERVQREHWDNIRRLKAIVRDAERPAE